MKTTRPPITDELIEKTKIFLGEDGLAFFKELKRKYGEYSPVFMDGGIPHPVHLREGMGIRNFMRSTGLCDAWDAYDFDNNWVFLIEGCLGDKNVSGKDI